MDMKLELAKKFGIYCPSFFFDREFFSNPSFKGLLEKQVQADQDNFVKVLAKVCRKDKANSEAKIKTILRAFADVNREALGAETDVWDAIVELKGGAFFRYFFMLFNKGVFEKPVKSRTEGEAEPKPAEPKPAEPKPAEQVTRKVRATVCRAWFPRSKAWDDFENIPDAIKARWEFPYQANNEMFVVIKQSEECPSAVLLYGFFLSAVGTKFSLPRGYTSNLSSEEIEVPVRSKKAKTEVSLPISRQERTATGETTRVYRSDLVKSVDRLPKPETVVADVYTVNFKPNVTYWGADKPEVVSNLEAKWESPCAANGERFAVIKNTGEQVTGFFVNLPNVKMTMNIKFLTNPRREVVDVSLWDKEPATSLSDKPEVVSKLETKWKSVYLANFAQNDRWSHLPINNPTIMGKWSIPYFADGQKFVATGHIVRSQNVIVEGFFSLLPNCKVLIPERYLKYCGIEDRSYNVDKTAKPISSDMRAKVRDYLKDQPPTTKPVSGKVSRKFKVCEANFSLNKDWHDLGIYEDELAKKWKAPALANGEKFIVFKKESLGTEPMIRGAFLSLPTVKINVQKSHFNNFHDEIIEVPARPNKATNTKPWSTLETYIVRFTPSLIWKDLGIDGSSVISEKWTYPHNSNGEKFIGIQTEGYKVKGHFFKFPNEIVSFGNDFLIGPVPESGLKNQSKETAKVPTEAPRAAKETEIVKMSAGASSKTGVLYTVNFSDKTDIGEIQDWSILGIQNSSQIAVKWPSPKDANGAKFFSTTEIPVTRHGMRTPLIVKFGYFLELPNRELGIPADFLTLASEIGQSRSTVELLGPKPVSRERAVFDKSQPLGGITFTVIQSGSHIDDRFKTNVDKNVQGPVHFVIRDPIRWGEFWKWNRPESTDTDVPDIDFAKNSVVVVFQHVRNQLQDRVSVQSVRRTSYNQIRVEVSCRELPMPGAAMIVGSIVSFPSETDNISVEAVFPNKGEDNEDKDPLIELIEKNSGWATVNLQEGKRICVIERIVGKEGTVRYWPEGTVSQVMLDRISPALLDLSFLPGYHPAHVCGVYCDGQEGPSSNCHAQKLLGQKILSSDKIESSNYSYKELVRMAKEINI